MVDAGEADHLALALRGLRGFKDFTGRSRRLEFPCYWLAAILIGLSLHLLLSIVTSYDAQRLITNTVGWIIFIPLVALFVRRLHDQDRSGWWTILLVAGPAWKAFSLHTPGGRDHPAITAVAVLYLILLAAFWLWPRTRGPNRYGPDPRQRESAMA